MVSEIPELRTPALLQGNQAEMMESTGISKDLHTRQGGR